jgi:hypothetical protein
MSQAELFKLKLEELQKRQEGLIDSVSRIQNQLHKLLINSLIENLNSQQGLILDNSDNLDLLEKFDDVFNKFDRVYGAGIAGIISDDFQSIAKLNEDYFEAFEIVNTQRFINIRRDVNKWLRINLGLNQKGGIHSGGFLDLVTSSDDLKEKLRKMTFKAITSGQPLETYTDSLKQLIVGTQDTDGELARHYKTFAYDQYQKFDRAHNQAFAKRLDLRAMIYEGGLIEDSRDFCEDKNGKVFTIEEMTKWKDDPKLLRSKAEKESGVVVDYNPAIDLGRWNCRHVARWISEQLAIRLRPELKAYFEGLKQAA